ncbi:MAG: CHAT domain-containing protein [Salinivirgaceae bacterium]|nr:CHAT domain-containing protein [Salinivirgaceae bacterium]
MNLHFFIDEAFQVFKFIENRISLSDPDFSWEYYYWLGITHRFNNDFNQALSCFDSSIYYCELSNKNDQYGKILYNKAKVYLRQGDRISALPLLIKGDRIIVKNNFAIVETKRRISSTYSINGEHRLALLYINEAIAWQLSEKNIEYVDNSRKIDSLFRYAGLLQSRAYVYREMAKGNPDSTMLLNKSVDDVISSIMAFEKSKRSLVFESDLIYSNNLYKYIYSKTIEAISRIYVTSPNETLLYEALQYAEMDKSSALLRTVQKDIALNQSNIPDSTVIYLKKLYTRLSEVEAKRFEENANVRVNDTNLYALNMELFDLVSEITELEKTLEKEYATYAELKYKVTPPNLDFIIDQSYEKAILEYVVSNEKLYAFLIVDGVIHYNHFYFRDDFIESIERLQEMISDIKNIDFSLKELNEFETLSYNLYGELIAPFDSLIGTKPLLIVPDEQLSLIPFEVLLTKKVKSKSLNYSNLPYLVKSNNVSYAYSLTLSHKQKNIKSGYEFNRLLAMAPTYEKLAGNQGAQYIALRSAFRDARDKLGMLEGAQDEARNVSKKVNGQLYLKDNASEGQFKAEAPHYKVLHLAMHTLINNENPLYSKLVFTPDVDEIEDGLLNTYELNNMNLNADLVVLSACNTGFGKLNKGEGIIGLTRGFLQAGCKSLLATLWSVADKASVTLIDGFYDGLKGGELKSASLSQAKRDYLNKVTGMNAHPFFWAGYISIGNDDPVIFDTNRKFYLPLIIVVVAILALAFFYKRKSRKSIPAFSQTKQTVP